MAQHEKFDVLGCRRATEQQQEAEDLHEDQVERAERHAGDHAPARQRCSLQVRLGPSSGTPHGRDCVRLRTDAAVTQWLSDPGAWETRAVAGSKGERVYAWAWVATTSSRHFLLIRKYLHTGELAYHYCYVPPGTPVTLATLATLVQVACLRWPVEEDFEFGKDHFGLDHSQVRLYTALQRHIVLAMAALAVCAVTAAEAKTRTPAPILPTTPDEQWAAPNFPDSCYWS